MAYLIRKSDPDIITVTYTGSVDMRERITSVDDVCSLVAPSITARLLIDVRNMRTNMTSDEQMYFGKYLASREKLLRAKTAILHDANNNPNMVINAVAFSRGYRITNFCSRNEAISWLLGKIP